MTGLSFRSGMKLLSAQNYVGLYQTCLSALKANDKNALAFFFLGVIAFENKQLGKDLEFFAKACELAPENARYQIYYAKALAAAGKEAKAREHTDIAACACTKDALVADMIGTLYSRFGDHKSALQFFKQATRLNPHWANFQFNLATSAQFLGDFDTARTAYIKAVSLRPDFARAWFALVSLEPQTPDNERREALKARFADASGNVDTRLLLGHALAKTLEDLGDYEESLEWLHKAKAAKKQQVCYSRHKTARTFAAAKSLNLPPPLPQTYKKPYPVFVVGLPRTGTTLVDRILSAHPDVVSAGETHLFERLTREQRIQAGKPVDTADTLSAAGHLNLEALRRDYSQYMHMVATDKQIMTDKTPLNFFYAGLISRIFSNARIVVLRRNAMDSCLSNYRQIFAEHVREYDYTFDLLDTAHYYCEFDALIRHWQQALPTDRFTEIHYETLVQNTEYETRKLLNFCGLEWDDACLRFFENAAPVDTASSVQVRRPVYTDAIDRWKKYGDKLDSLKDVLGEHFYS